MTKEEDNKAQVNTADEEGKEKHVSHTSRSMKAEVEEVDEFGLKIKHVKTRLYEEPATSEAEGSKPAVADSSDENSEGFKTPMGDAEEHNGAEEVPASREVALEQGPKSEAIDIPIPKSEQGLRTIESSDQVQPGLTDIADEEPPPESPNKNIESPEASRRHSKALTASPEKSRGVSEWSHMQLAPKEDEEKKEADEGEWQVMPAFATHTIYDDWGKVLAREERELEESEDKGYTNLGGASKGYTKVQLDEDAMSATSMDEDTAYLFKQPKSTAIMEEDEEGRDMLSQMQATKDLLTEGQRVAYVAVVKIAGMEMYREVDKLERTRGSKKNVEATLEALRKWSQKIMVRLYGHMEIDSQEQVMIEQLAEHGVQASDLTPTLMQNARVRNPMKETDEKEVEDKETEEKAVDDKLSEPPLYNQAERSSTEQLPPYSPPETPGAVPAPYDEEMAPGDMSIQSPSAIADQTKIDIDLRWTVLCDLFLVLVADSSYDSRSRTLLEHVGKALQVDWIDVCRFEKRITDALEMQEAADKENWNEEEHMKEREKMARNRKLVMMGLATVGGGLVIGLSAGLLAPVIGAGFAAGFTTIGVAGTSTFFGGAGAAALITSTGVITGSTIAGRASSRRMGAVKTFEYRPLHNNKRVNLIVTVAGWMTGKVDDVRLPFSTVDPIMGDIYSILWEPEMLQSMGQTINILATEALTQGLQQILGSTILVTLMAALQLPLVLTKLSYLIDNPWNVSLARADQAGLILADSLMDRNLGSRPITLCGFSIGSRVIYSCLKELAKRGQHGLVQNVYLYGSPMVASKDEYIRCRAVVSGRFLNGYATNDWILGYLFRATSGGVMRVAGLAPVEVAGVENVDVTAHVPGHMSYRAAMPRLLQEAGWAVEALEFSEIEDPDPENHEKRQRELINEIEEARKKLEAKPSRKGLKALFSKNKKAAEKKEWETYDERARKAADDGEAREVDPNQQVLFDVEAIIREVAELSAQGIEVREIKGTLPPLKVSSVDPIAGDRSGVSSASSSPRGLPLRQSPSFNAGPDQGHRGRLSHESSKTSLRGDNSAAAVATNGASSSGMLSPASPGLTNVKSGGGWWSRGAREKTPEDNGAKRSHGDDGSRKGSPAPDRSPTAPTGGLGGGGVAAAAGGVAVGGGAAYGASHNAWTADAEFEYESERELEMTFE